MTSASALPSTRSLPWGDVLAGLSVAGVLLPEAVAYAAIAGVPPIHALLAALVGLAVYPLVGSSRFAIVAPTSSAATNAPAALMLESYETLASALQSEVLTEMAGTFCRSSPQGRRDRSVSRPRQPVRSRQRRSSAS